MRFRRCLGGGCQVAVGRCDQRAAAGVRGEDPRTGKHGGALLERRQHRARASHVAELDDCLDVIGLEAVAGRLALPLRIDDRLRSRVLAVRRRRVGERQRDEAEQPVAEQRPAWSPRTWRRSPRRPPAPRRAGRGGHRRARVRRASPRAAPTTRCGRRAPCTRRPDDPLRPSRPSSTRSPRAGRAFPARWSRPLPTARARGRARRTRGASAKRSCKSGHIPSTGLVSSQSIGRSCSSRPRR